MTAYIRVKDPETRHEFDMPENHPHIAKGLVEHVKPKQYPPSPTARRPKHHLDLAGQSATRPTPESDDAGEVTTKEN